MGKIIFFTGGSRSGKSKFAEEYIYENQYKNKNLFCNCNSFWRRNARQNRKTY